MVFETYVGLSVVMVYRDAKGAITKRSVAVRAVTDKHLWGYCRMARGPRVFKLSGVLAIRAEARVG